MSTGRRRDFVAGALLTGLGVVAVQGCARNENGFIHGGHGVDENTVGLTPDQALAKLKDGNHRFAEMRETMPNNSNSRLMAVSSRQDPFVGVLGCVDSRVPPELVFDRGLGDIFDSRVAGAIPVPPAIGSLEFGVEEFGVPLLVVLGHSNCGAVTAAVKAVRSGQATAPGSIGAVLDPIIPAVQAVQSRGVSGDAVLPAAIEEVVRRGVATLNASTVLKPKQAQGVLNIVGAVYDLHTGRVRFLEATA